MPSTKLMAASRARERGQRVTEVSPRYSVLVVLNDAYGKFGTLFLNSLHAHADTSRIESIYVGDVGLSHDSRRYFARYPKVEIVDTGVRSDFTGIHCADWLATVATKSKLLLGLVQRQTLPLCMIDADCLVVGEFGHLLDPSFDVQVCLRNRPVRRRDGRTLRYIGSFLVVNARRASDFLQSWIEEIERMAAARELPAHETPALCRTIEGYRDRLRIGALAESQVSCDRALEANTLLIHMKSHGRGVISAERSFLERVRSVRNLSPERILSYLERSPRLAPERAKP